MINALRVTRFKKAFQPKYDGEKYDLRLNGMVEGLRELVDSYDIQALSPTDKKLVPFLVILVKNIDEWKAEVFLG